MSLACWVVVDGENLEVSHKGSAECAKSYLVLAFLRLLTLKLTLKAGHAVRRRIWVRKWYLTVYDDETDASGKCLG